MYDKWFDVNLKLYIPIDSFNIYTKNDDKIILFGGF